MSINSAPTTTTTNVTLSGINVSVNISGQTVIASISGQTVSSTANISGQLIGNLVYDTSGQTWREWTTGASGSQRPLVAISDPSSANIVILNTSNTDTRQTTTIGIPSSAYIHGYDPTIDRLVRIRVTSSGQGISGVTNKLIVGFSGDTAFEYGTAVRAHPFTVVTNLSGGTEAGSGSCFGVTVRNHSGNGPMLLGGTGSEAPFSGKGMIVYGGESYDLKVDNFNKVRALAYTSGQLISVAGIDK